MPVLLSLLSYDNIMSNTNHLRFFQSVPVLGNDPRCVILWDNIRSTYPSHWSWCFRMVIPIELSSPCLKTPPGFTHLHKYADTLTASNCSLPRLSACINFCQSYISVLHLESAKYISCLRTLIPNWLSVVFMAWVLSRILKELVTKLILINTIHNVTQIQTLFISFPMRITGWPTYSFTLLSFLYFSWKIS